jgi:ABC-type polysaccharide/polyol phosphate transport system ATPase subunit
MSDLVLSVEGLWKKFAPGLRRASAYGLSDMARELLPFGRCEAALRPGEFWALRDINLELQRGQALAVVGHNGAGKSTLLKLLYGLLKPDRGRIAINGRCEAIIELGTGFMPLLSGRENIELAADVRGLGGPARRDLIEQVVTFADIGGAVDAPMQSYSSGMKSRLSFALTAHLGAELLLVDEVLAVGDMAFQRKCVNLMKSYVADGGSLIFISHNAFQVQRMCDAGLVLHKGEQVLSGSSLEAINLLLEMRAPSQPPPAEKSVAAKGEIEITGIEALPIGDDSLRSGGSALIRMTYIAPKPVDVFWGFSIWTQDQWVRVTGEVSPEPVTLHAGSGELTCVATKIPLVGGRYVLRGAILESATEQPLAMRGFDDAPTQMLVREPLDRSSNNKMAADQLIHMEVDWSRGERPQDRASR